MAQSCPRCGCAVPSGGGHALQAALQVDDLDAVGGAVAVDERLDAVGEGVAVGDRGGACAQDLLGAVDVADEFGRSRP